mmetsp:Transcript_21599/g.54398  ORF Transcript_21599/g.54398 Transcript_21599/m.54398 type:complete len:89 (+) Transcript_21599:410-676(+)
MQLHLGAVCPLVRVESGRWLETSMSQLSAQDKVLVAESGHSLSEMGLLVVVVLLLFFVVVLLEMVFVVLKMAFVAEVLLLPLWCGRDG